MSLYELDTHFALLRSEDWVDKGDDCVECGKVACGCSSLLPERADVGPEWLCCDCADEECDDGRERPAG